MLSRRHRHSIFLSLLKLVVITEYVLDTAFDILSQASNGDNINRRAGFEMAFSVVKEYIEELITKFGG